MKACKFKDVSPEQYFIVLNECKYGHSSEFLLYGSVCGLWCRPSGQIHDEKGLFREVETQLSLKQRVFLLQSDLPAAFLL